MTIRTQQQAYSVAQGTSPTDAFKFETRDPSANDITYPLYQGWVNTNTKGIWYLETLLSSAGVVTAQWRAVGPIVVSSTSPAAPLTASADYAYPIGQTWCDSTANDYYVMVSNPSSTTGYWVKLSAGTQGVDLLTGNAGGAVGPDSSGNTNILGDPAQIVVTGNPATNTLTLTLAGGGSAVDSFAPDTGTNPVVPTAGGLVNVKGQNPASVSGIRVTGALNELDIAMFSPFVGDFTFTKSTAAATETLTVSNTDNTALSASSACGAMSVGGTTQTGDAYSQWNVGAARSFSMGPDTTDSQALKINTTAAAGVTPSSGTLIWKATTAGEITKPLQPCFHANLSTRTAFNQTGDGTIVTIIFNTEQVDAGSNYNNATGVFTAPISGNYFFCANVTLINLSALHTSGNINFVGTANSYMAQLISPGAIRDTATFATLTGSILTPMTAADTMRINITVSGSTKTVGLEGDNGVAAGTTSFQGYLVS